MSCSFRVLLGPQVQVTRRVLDISDDLLERLAVLLDEHESARLDLARSLITGVPNQVRVEIATELHVLRRGERYVGIQLLREPQAPLTRGQRK